MGGNYVHEVRLKAQGSTPIVPDQIILHSLANNNNFEAGWSWMVSPSNQLEAHVAIRLDGYRRQAVPYRMRADANYHANSDDRGYGAISVETDSSINAEEPWTPDQVESTVELLTELCLEFDIPARLCRDPEDPGIGWHIMWGTPGEWTPVAKACPGPARIKQVPGIVERVAKNLALHEPEEPEMPENTELADIITRIDKLERSLRSEIRAETRASGKRIILDMRNGFKGAIAQILAKIAK